MTYFLRQSSTNDAIMARVHATAALRDLATASSCSRPLSLTTLSSPPYVSNTANTSRRNSARFFRVNVARYARTKAPSSASSGEVGGKSSASDGGRVVWSGIVRPTSDAPRRPVGEGETAYSQDCKQNHRVNRETDISPHSISAAHAPPGAASDAGAPAASARLSPGNPIPATTAERAGRTIEHESNNDWSGVA